MTAIIVHIAPNPDGTHCGECEGPDGLGRCHWHASANPEDAEWTRGPECLRAERLLADLREATRRLLDSGVIAENDPGDGTAIPNAEAALAALDAIKEEAK